MLSDKVGADTGRPVDSRGEHDEIRKHQLGSMGDEEIYRCSDCGLYTLGNPQGLGVFDCREDAISGGDR